ncbi:MAG: DNA polymerase I [Bacteroidales bacterium]|nr:DNA polymerase I [Bacteroidales bacterium]
MMPDKLYLIDGHALIFKMYYAFARRPMINSKGMDMSILFGFTKYLLELIEREQPTHLAVAFDPPGGTFRNEMYPAYKANRSETPQLVIDALEPLTELCEALDIPVLMQRGYEADDVIGTVARRYGAVGTDVYMVTPDKDYGQLIADHVFQVKPGKSGGEDEVVDKAAVCGKYGIQDPSQVIEMLTLCGDTADNVPGVKGVGEVGAAKLIAKYGTVENIYAHLGELSARQQAMFQEARDHIALSHELVTIKTDVPVETDLEQMRLTRAYSPRVADLFEKYEFNSLRKYIAHIAPSAQAPQKKDLAFEAAGVAEVAKAASRSGCLSLVVEPEGEGIFAPVRRITVAAGDPCRVASGTPADFKAVLEDPAIGKYGHDLKFQANLLDHAGISLAGRLLDIGLMHYLTDPEKSHKPDILAKAYLGLDMEEDLEEAPVSLFDVPEQTDPGREREAAILLQLGPAVRADMEDKGVTTLYEEIEEPLIRVLARMERNGVRVDLAQLRSYAEGLRRETEALEAEVREMAGEPGLNVSSPKQIGDVLFDKLKLDAKAKKNKNGSYSTDETTLQYLTDRHPIVGKILEFRAVKKLLSTYIEPFPGYVSPSDGKIHTTFNQALTATGRLSSSGPNLQNIPIRTERGMQIRKAFVPSTPDGLILSADYSQIELRIMAHLCGDAHLLQAFRDGVDVHAATAAKIFGIPVSEVTREQRGIAKTANFGIMYGISSFGLAQRLQVSRTAAKQIIDDYFAAFPSIRTFIDQTTAAAREKGYVETLFGRRRYLPDITSRNQTIRALAERNAVNAPIQGTSADIIKLAMISVQRRMDAEGLRSRMVLQIHDELVFDTFPDEVEALRRVVVEEMEHVITLSVPLTAQCNYGKNWLEAH